MEQTGLVVNFVYWNDIETYLYCSCLTCVLMFIHNSKIQNVNWPTQLLHVQWVVNIETCLHQWFPYMY